MGERRRKTSATLVSSTSVKSVMGLRARPGELCCDSAGNGNLRMLATFRRNPQSERVDQVDRLELFGSERAPLFICLRSTSRPLSFNVQDRLSSLATPFDGRCSPPLVLLSPMR